ncbi:MAG: hypothetical protein IPK98_18275 [Chloracidobacterium sp.]|nr:hypothetical protein [Chloracidobacterium sp.]
MTTLFRSALQDRSRNRPFQFMVGGAFFFLSLFTIHCSLFTATAVAQSRDFLTAEEVEIIRDAQQIDDRMDVLVKAIDRRFEALNAPVSVPVVGKVKKDDREWGKAPTGTRIELLFDIKRILQKAIDDIDNLAERPDSMVVDPDEKPDKKRPKTFEALFPKAVRSLAAAATRYQPVLKAELDRSTDNAEKGLILAALDMCSDVIASVAKLPAAVKKEKN